MKNNLRHLFFFLSLLLIFTSTVDGQKRKRRNRNKTEDFKKEPVRWGFIHSTKILHKMPEFQEAKFQSDTLLFAWKTTYQQKKDSLKKEQQSYQDIRLSLPIEERILQEKYLNAKQDSLKFYQNKIFGLDGLYFKKKQELMRIALDKLFLAADKVAKEKELKMLFDRDNSEYIIYANEDHDYSDFVLEALKLGDPLDKVR